jgi:anthranilate synthase/aminodeoxychorismate synthase-like glutamine amidotransferase
VESLRRTTKSSFFWQAGKVTRVVVIDSYDSFVYNLVQYLGELGVEPVVHRNDAISVVEVLALAPDAVLLSPGPGRPEDAGIICDLIPACAVAGIPLLGVCLGHQAIGHVYGAQVVHAPELMHGKTSEIRHTNQGVFAGLPNPLTATRYHSLVVDAGSLPDCLEVTATVINPTVINPTVINPTGPDMVMGMRHREYDVEGVQFHPESILTAAGHELLANFVRRAGHEVAGFSRRW